MSFVKRTALSARVRPTVVGGKSVGRDMRVDLCASEARMPEHFLHDPKVCAAVEHMRGGRVPKGVRPAGPAARSSFKFVGYKLVDDGGAERSPSATQEEFWARRPVHSPRRNLWPPRRKIRFQCASGRRPHGHHSLFIALANDTHGPFATVETVYVKAAEF